MELEDVIRTTFAARDFKDEAVSDQTIAEILDVARFAPSGGNRQGWKVIVVREEQTRKAVASIMQPAVQRYIAQYMAGESPWNTIVPTELSPETIETTNPPEGFVENLTGAPVLLFVFLDLSVVASFDQNLSRVGVISGCSIYPFVWNILLTARSKGLGGTPTTFAAANEDQLKELLGVPSEYAFATMIPLGYPVKQLTKLTRKPISKFAVLERFDGEALSRE